MTRHVRVAANVHAAGVQHRTARRIPDDHVDVEDQVGHFLDPADHRHLRPGFRRERGLAAPTIPQIPRPRLGRDRGGVHRQVFPGTGQQVPKLAIELPQARLLIPARAALLAFQAGVVQLEAEDRRSLRFRLRRNYAAERDNSGWLGIAEISWRPGHATRSASAFAGGVRLDRPGAIVHASGMKRPKSGMRNGLRSVTGG